MKTITNFKIHKDLPPVVKAKDIVAWDTEFHMMNKDRLHRPDNGTFASMACTINGKDVYIITEESDIKQFFKNIEAGTWVLQNAKFDLIHMRRYAKLPQRTKLWDTMLIEQIMYSGYYNDFGLQDLARRYLQVYMPKDVRKQFESSTKMTKEQIEYAAIDVIVTWHVYQAQIKIISGTDLDIWHGIELPFLWSILSMSGITLDTDKWLKLAKENADRAAAIQKKHKSINLNSPAQVMKELVRRGYTKMKSTNEEALSYIANDCKFAQDVLDFRSVSKRAGTYGENFVKDFVEADGRIYADIYSIGAETGRTACRRPNLQNQPNDEKYRECYIAGKGNSLIIADWGSQEPRIAAYLSGDEGLLKIFKTKKDIYIEVAREALNMNITKSDPKRKKVVKPTVLGIFYGMSAFGLSKRIGVDEGLAQHMIDSIFETFPGVAEYDVRQRKAGQNVTSILGRKVWLNHHMNGWERNALNAPIQSSAADAMKIAAFKFLQEWHGKDFYKGTALVLLVHDEIVIEVPTKDAKKAEKTLKKVMIGVAEAMHSGIPAEVETYIGKSWAEKK